MPGGAVGGIGGERARGQIARRLGAAAAEPVRVRESDEGARVVGPFGDDALVHRTGDLGHRPIRFDCRDEIVEVGGGCDREQPLEQDGELVRLAVRLDGERDGGGGIGG